MKWTRGSYASTRHSRWSDWTLTIDKLILVSQRGFTAPAVAKARFYDIETLTIEQALAADWPLLAKLESSGFFQLVTMNFKCRFSVRFGDDSASEIDAPLSTLLTTGGATATVDQVVRLLLDQKEFREALHPHIGGTGQHDFHLVYEHGTSLGSMDHGGRDATIKQLLIDLNVVHRESPVALATGAFRATPFMSGVGKGGTAPLQFVLAKKPNGQVSGYLVDGKNVHTLTSTTTHGE